MSARTGFVIGVGIAECVEVLNAIDNIEPFRVVEGTYYFKNKGSKAGYWKCSKHEAFAAGFAWLH